MDPSIPSSGSSAGTMQTLKEAVSFLNMSKLGVSSSDDGDRSNRAAIEMETTASKSSNFSRDKMFAAIFYGIASLAVIFTNKSIMNQFYFPHFDFLATVQFIATTAVLTVLIVMKKIDVPYLTPKIAREIFPVSLMFLGNVICGLGSTKSLSLPMFTALRRFSIFMTMIGEWIFLSNRPSEAVVFSVALMVGGAFVAAMDDLSFDSFGYTMIFLNNICTALNGVWMKKATISGVCTKMGVLYYNSLFSAVFMIAYFMVEDIYAMKQETIAANIAAEKSLLYSLVSADRRHLRGLVETVLEGSAAAAETGAAAAESIHSGVVAQETALYISTLHAVYNFGQWNSLSFQIMFVLAAFMGSVLNYSIFLCTTLNSALTTAVVGALKNVATTYIGMITFSDYAFSWVNFIGINVSIAGSLYYTWVTIFRSKSGTGSTPRTLSPERDDSEDSIREEVEKGKGNGKEREDNRVKKQGSSSNNKNNNNSQQLSQQQWAGIADRMIDSPIASASSSSSSASASGSSSFLALITPRRVSNAGGSNSITGPSGSVSGTGGGGTPGGVCDRGGERGRSSSPGTSRSVSRKGSGIPSDYGNDNKEV